MTGPSLTPSLMSHTSFHLRLHFLHVQGLMPEVPGGLSTLYLPPEMIKLANTPAFAVSTASRLHTAHATPTAAHSSGLPSSSTAYH